MNVPAASNGRTAVIVRTRISPRKYIYGVQFWTPAMIEGKTSLNGDMTTCEYVEHLHPTA